MKPHRIALASLASHSIGNVIYRLASLALVAIYADRLGPDAFGRLEQLLAVSLLIIPVVSLQVQEAFLPVYWKMPDCGAQTAGAMIVVVIVAVAAVGGAFYFLNDISATIVSALVLHVATTIAWQFIRNLVRATQKLRSLLLGEVLQSCVLLVSGIALLNAGVGFVGAIAAIAIGNAVACACTIFAADKVREALDPREASWFGFREIVRISSKLVPNVMLWWVIELSDRLILAHFMGDHDVGIYSAGARMAGIGMAACLLVYQSWQVLAIRSLGNEGAGAFFQTTLYWYAAGVSLIFSALLCFIDPLSNLLFGGQFEESGKYAAALIPGFYLSAFCYFFGVILYRSESGVSPWQASSAGFVVSVAVNFSLIPVVGLYAAALASFLAYATILLFRYNESAQSMRVKLRFVKFLVPLLILMAQGISIIAGASPGITAIGFVALVALWWREIVPFLRSIGSATFSRT